MGTDHGKDPKLVDWSFGITAAVAGLLFVLLRLLAISHYDWRTAFALADSVDLGNAPSVILGTVLGAPGPMAAALAVLLPITVTAHALAYRRGQRRVGRLLIILAATALLVTGIITYRMWWAVGLFAATAFALLLLLRIRGLIRRFVIDDILARVGLIAFTAMLLIAALTDEVWVPKERITTRGAEIIGYVMSTDDQFIKVLTAVDRKVIYVLGDDVTGRTELD